MESPTPLSNTIYDIFKAMGKDAEFLYDTIDKYTDDAEKANKKELANTWRKIKSDYIISISNMSSIIIVEGMNLVSFHINTSSKLNFPPIIDETMESGDWVSSSNHHHT